ncbi:MAG: hypothetical protein R3B72_20355 [Polyangiaceae bacterium]
MKIRYLFGAGLVGLAIAGGCTAGTSFPEGGGGAGAGDQTGGSGGTVSTGGNVATGGSGGENTSNCSVDCSQITTSQCQVAVCNESTGNCEVVPDENGTTCDDGVFCSVNDTCQDGMCVGGGANDCGIQSTACEEVVCDEVSETCSLNPLGNGTSCTPDDLCQVNGACTNGLCVGQPKDCFFAPVDNECHTAVCNPMNGVCESQPDSTKDGNGCIDATQLCQDGMTCLAGTCQGGAPKDCSNLSVGCNNGVCNTMTGVCEAIPIQDGMPCLEATDDCNQGICTMGSCVGSPINQGGMCDDGLSCTTGTTCNNGTCAGGTSTISIYFSEDFSSNSQGWTLGTNWSIGPAMVSSGHSVSCGNADPGTDHSTSTDNGVAGVVIGGNAPTSSTHPYFYLTSPPVDTSAAPTVWLQYERWLNSDYPSFMTNIVEVFNGTSWVTVWVQPSNSTVINDSAWTTFTHDITAYKNSAMQVRFGYQIGSTGVFTCSQWNIDDVVIASGTCL